MKKIVDLGGHDHFNVFAVHNTIIPWIRATFGIYTAVVNIPSMGGEGRYVYLSQEQATLLRLKFQ